MSLSREKYRKFCKGREDVPIFALPQWMDCASRDGHWDVVLCTDKNDQITAAMVYDRFKKGPFSVIENPPHTPYAGPWIIDKNEKKSAFKIHQKLATQLPASAALRLNLFPNSGELVPYHWKSYEIHQRYTFICLLEGDMEDIRSRYSSGIRNTLRKSPEDYIIKTPAWSEFYQNYNAVQKENHDHRIYWQKQKSADLMQFLSDHGYDIYLREYLRHGSSVSGLCCIGDGNTAYYLFSYNRSDHRKAQLNAHLLDGALAYYAQKAYSSFDFEGSMLDGVFQYMRKFGGDCRPYGSIRKSSSVLYDLLRRLR